MSKQYFRLFHQKKCYRPTWFGWLIILLVLAIFFRLSLPLPIKYLSLNKPVNAKTLVVEGWVETYVVMDALKYYHENGYKRLIVTGIPITIYEYIAPYRNTAEATIFSMKHFGFTDTIYRAVIPSNTFTDRTYSTGLMVGQLFDDHPEWEKSVDIYSVGVHARRSRYLFKMALGKLFQVGIISHPDRTFLADHWWKSSKGFRNVTNEMIATPYALLFFNPDRTVINQRMSQGMLIDEILESRAIKHLEFADSLTSPFNKEELAEFAGFSYFDPDLTYRLQATFKVDTSQPPFSLPTTTDRLPVYRKYGTLKFYLNNDTCELTAFQNMAFIHHPEYGSQLFVPFGDLTNGEETYKAGRFMDIPIPARDSAVLDFNQAYNPYCAYNERWSCPLVPFENQLNIRIPAGEKKYKH